MRRGGCGIDGGPLIEIVDGIANKDETANHNMPKRHASRPIFDSPN